jgi:hypothetical protein
VWKHLKADTVGRMAVTGKTDFKRKVRSSMRRLKTTPEKSARSIRSNLSNTPRECSLTYSLINKSDETPDGPFIASHGCVGRPDAVRRQV